MFVRGYQPKWIFNDLTGKPLDDTYFIFFRENTLPYLPKTVYQDPNGNAAWSYPIQFQPNGMLPDNIFFTPDAVYRVEVRHGQTDNDQLIYVIENYLAVESEPEADSLTTASNMITNPQFADIYFNGSYTYTQGSSATYILNIAPGWQLVLTGAGTTVITQVANSGSNNIDGNPPYYLTLNNTGWTQVVLQQVFNNNGALYANGALAITLLANATGAAQTVTFSLVPSVGSALFSDSILINTGGLEYYYAAGDTATSTNSSTGQAATTTFKISMPGTSIMSFTNIQLVGQSTPLSGGFVPPDDMIQGGAPAFQEQTYQREVDQEFHVYQNSIMNESKNSLLTAWNFANNPWQFLATTPTTLTANQYTADQTIVIQQNYANGSTASNISVQQASLANDLGFQVNAVTATNQFALLQWIAPQSIAQYWGQVVSCMVKAFLNTMHTSTVTFKARLIYKAGLPNSTAQHDPIVSWGSGSDPVAAAGYNLITPLFDPVYTLGAFSQQFTFDGFQLPLSTDPNMTLGILIYTVSNMNQTATADSIVFNDISLVPNDFALPTQSETFDETLRKCQYYYEKSYDPGILPQTMDAATVASCLYFIQSAGSNNGTDTQFWPAPFTINYKSIKNQPPSTFSVYSPVSSVIDMMSAVVYSSSSSSSTPGTDISVSNYTVSFTGLSTATFLTVAAAKIGPQASGITPPQVAYIYLHYTVDSRLGA